MPPFFLTGLDEVSATGTDCMRNQEDGHDEMARKRLWEMALTMT